MMQVTKSIAITAILLSICKIAYSSTSIYGSSFDYRKATPAKEKFGGKSNEQIANFCNGDARATIEIADCTQFEFEASAAALDKLVQETEREIAGSDKARAKDDEPAALPYLKAAQSSWQKYRDSQCYSETYALGQASIRFIDFWSCMNRITKNRIVELSAPSKD